MNIKSTFLLLGALLMLNQGIAPLLSQESAARDSESRTMDCSGSSAISSARYWPESGLMTMTFHSSPGRTYCFANFPEALWRAWDVATSKGRFYQKQISGRQSLAESSHAHPSGRSALASKSGF